MDLVKNFSLRLWCCGSDKATFGLWAQGKLLAAAVALETLSLLGQAGLAQTEVGDGREQVVVAAVMADVPEGLPEDGLEGVAPADHGPAALADDGAVAPAGVTGPPTSRLSGPDRYASAAAISRWKYADPTQADVVYLARGDVFADALTAGTLSDGPVLLTRGGCNSVPGVVLSEIGRITRTR